VLRIGARVGGPLLRLKPVASRDLARRLTAEGLGTMLLVTTIVGSGIAAQRLSPGNTGLQLLESSIATGAVLVALILALGSVSGGHFNPVVSLADRLLGGLSSVETAAYSVAQVVGAAVGAIVANVMFSEPAVTLSTEVRSGRGIWLGEVVATFGLLVVILGVVRSRHREVAPYAVGAYIAAAYWSTSSTSFANPAVTLARTLTDTFSGIAPSSVPAFIVAQLVGSLVAVGLAWYLFTGLSGDPVVVAREIDSAPTGTGA
jgi:glycerol uptake facilitator-like aquaporin